MGRLFDFLFGPSKTDRYYYECEKAFQESERLKLEQESKKEE